MFWPFTSNRKARAAQSERFGPYTILRPIHEGEKAFVYLARSTETGEKAAIKVYKPNFDRAAHQMRKKYRLRREGEIGLLLNPPAGVDPATYPIVRTLATGREGGRPDGAVYIIMEFIEGASLKGLMTTSDPNLASRRVAICRECARALDIVHSHGLVHRDVCPDNFLVNNRWEPKLIDLGFCVPPGMTFEEKTGTVSYMSPEQISVGPITPQTDVYGLGAVMYELFTRRPPFTSNIKLGNERLAQRRNNEIMDQHLHAKPAPPSQIAPDVPPALDAVILKCLEKSPERRYPSMKELMRDLGEIR
ncbi:MAG TPA: serine/threonine-protein kinase [Candidatus Brocadiia bacterium]|nr:serine/threonine-protein kinase [Candidatus Brocadiia bacterium]